MCYLLYVICDLILFSFSDLCFNLISCLITFAAQQRGCRPAIRTAAVILSRTSRNQEGNASPSAVRANLDDPPIHIRPVCSRISGCEGKNRVGSSHYGTPTIAPRLRDRKGFLRSK